MFSTPHYTLNHPYYILLRQIFTRLIYSDSLVGFDFEFHDSLSPFEVKYDSLTLRVSQDDPHPLGLRREWEVGQDLILLHDPRRVLYHYLLLVSLHQLHTQ